MSDVINELILNTRRQHPVAGIVVTHDMRTAQKVATGSSCSIPSRG